MSSSEDSVEEAKKLFDDFYDCFVRKVTENYVKGLSESPVEIDSETSEKVLNEFFTGFREQFAENLTTLHDKR